MIRIIHHMDCMLYIEDKAKCFKLSIVILPTSLTPKINLLN